MFKTVNFTGAVAASTALVAAPATGQILVKKIVASVAKVQSGKVLKFYEHGSSTPFFVVDLGTAGATVFDPSTDGNGDYYPLTAATALDYEADSTTGNTNCSIVLNYGVI